jgi:shikimate dehydrogenase
MSAQPYAEVIGDPIAHSKSPLIHNFWLEKLGIEAVYRTCHVRPGEVADYFTARRADPLWRGCSVTIPHKEKVQPHLDTADEKARAIGAVNTVFREESGTLIGTNTDVDGVDEALAGLDLRGHKACVLGAGGAGRAAFASLARRGCDAVHILARNPEKAVAVADSCGVRAVGVRFEAGSSALHGARLLINATQLGMTGQEQMPGFVLSELEHMAEGALVFDMVYAPLETGLLAAARRSGIRTSDGLVMLISQAARAFGLFFGQSPPREYDAQLRERLTA